MNYCHATDLDSLWPGEMTGIRIGSLKVLLANVGGTVVAYEDRCAHKGVELSKGRLDGCTLTCSAHEWKYDIRTGAGENPIGVQLRKLPVKVEANQVLVDVSDAEPT